MTSHSSGALVEFVSVAAKANTLDELQTHYLDGVLDYVGAFAAGIYVFDPRTRDVESFDARGVSDYFLSRYEQLGRGQDPVLSQALELGSAVHNRQLMSSEEWRLHPLYREVCGLHRMAHLLQAPILDADGQVAGTLNFGRHEDQGRFTDQDRRTAATLGRLLGMALGAMKTQLSAERERDRVLAALELCCEAVVVTDLAIAERLTNAPARALLDRLADPECCLAELTGGVVRRGEVTSHETTVALAEGSEARLQARTSTVPDMPDVMVTFLGFAADQPSLPVLASAAQLTAREREVAHLAASGLRDKEIAERLFLSPYTVKHHLKACYRKLGVRSRVDLARLMHGGALEPAAEAESG